MIADTVLFRNFGIGGFRDFVIYKSQNSAIPKSEIYKQHLSR
jgi:hypothetical protein